MLNYSLTEDDWPFPWELIPVTMLTLKLKKKSLLITGKKTKWIMFLF